MHLPCASQPALRAPRIMSDAQTLSCRRKQSENTHGGGHAWSPLGSANSWAGLAKACLGKSRGGPGARSPGLLASTRVSRRPPSMTKPKHRVRNEAWRRFFTVEKRAQIKERFAFLTQHYEFGGPEAVEDTRERFNAILEQLGRPVKRKQSDQPSAQSGQARSSSPSQRRPQEAKAFFHKAPRREPVPEVILGRPASLKQQRRLHHQLASLAPRRPPFMRRSIQLEPKELLF
jgi:hypothetical protein